MGIVRKTKSVKAMLNIFEQTDAAIPVLELIKRLHQEMNKTTVYRILDRLENEGFLHSFVGKDGLRWYAKCKDSPSTPQLDSHPHFQCQVCGKTECLHIDIPIPPISNYKINAAEILLIGQCKDCK
ncbi:MAG: transcriptional repressor [Bacteroidota bacterium]